jgi:beta-glucosidase/6-phospho-beta-glucosidase/beta-galactosidase
MLRARSMLWATGYFMGPMLGSCYPADLLADTSAITDWSFVQDGDEAAIAAVGSGGIDVLGVNYYVDYTSQERTWKDSAHWYCDLFARWKDRRL